MLFVCLLLCCVLLLPSMRVDCLCCCGVDVFCIVVNGLLVCLVCGVVASLQTVVFCVMRVVLVRCC